MNAPALPTLTEARLNKILDGEELVYSKDDDGDIVVPFEDVVYFFTIKENLLRISGWWRADLKDFQDFPRLLHAANAINSQAFFPKVVVALQISTVVFECALPTGKGVTDEQVQRFIVDAFGASFAAATRLAEEFPEIAPTTGADAQEEK